ncbi:MAG: insulinase family protein [Clostridia bacterium]|nr:insulinase family protein [Clostridia bacterium]
MVYYKELKNGIRLVVKQMTGLNSVSMGILVKTGACVETDEEDGLSHFIEHMMFKGTKTMNAFQISDEMEKIGAQDNAFTGKDSTCYYVKSTTDHAERAFEILADIFTGSVFPPEEMAREKGVIHEEISMTEDTPDDLCLDLICEAFYGKTGYGRNILGSHENLEKFSRTDIFSYMEKFYTADNIVIAMAGNIDLSVAENLAEKYFSSYPAKKSAKRDVKIEYAHGSILRMKDIEQVHIALAYPSVEREHRLFDASQIMNGVLGGGMSSRLFQTVREKMGLAYTVYSYLSPYDDTGSLIIYAGVNAANYMKALDAIYGCVEDIRKKDITEGEFLKVKEQMLASNVFSQESTSSQMLLYGKELLYNDRIYDMDKRLRDIKDIKIGDVYDAIDLNFGKDMAAAVVGAAEDPVKL